MDEDSDYIVKEIKTLKSRKEEFVPYLKEIIKKVYKELTVEQKDKVDNFCELVED